MYVRALGVLAPPLLHASAVRYSQYIFSVVGPNLPPEQLGSILSTLLDGLQGRTWDGKVISTARAKSFYYVLSVSFLMMATIEGFHCRIKNILELIITMVGPSSLYRCGSILRRCTYVCT